MKYFVIVFDTETATLTSLSAHDTSEDALSARFQRELEYDSPSSVEIVVLRAPSEDAVRQSHPRYFARSAD